MKSRALFRIFLSSPTDVQPEREAAERAVRRLAGIYASHVDLRLERWEPHFYQATRSFQEQIESIANFDLVVGVFWKRIGTALSGEIYCREDGTPFESGTVFEIESALEASAQHGKPLVFVFRKVAPIQFFKETVEAEKLQSDQLDAWWNRTFLDERRLFCRAWVQFATEQAFETRFEDLIVEHLHKKGLIPSGPVWDVKTCGSPYPGLQPYERDRRSVFFGMTLTTRDAVEELKAAVSRERGLPALFIIGPSGCGKSSLIRAGVAPMLTDPGMIPNVDFWRTVTIDVDAGVLATLGARLYASDGLPEMASSPQRDAAAWTRLAACSPADATEVVSWALDRIESAEMLRCVSQRRLSVHLTLVVDQLERLFGTGDAPLLPPVLLALVESKRVWLISTIRSDRYAELQRDPALLELKRRGAAYDMPAPGEAEITDAVKGPARAAGLVFQPGDRDGRSLPYALVHETPSADVLPLLQMTLRRLFEAREGTELTWRAYQEMGGVRGAIAAHADAVLAKTSPEARRELSKLVDNLVRDVHREAGGRIDFIATATEAGWASSEPRRALTDSLVSARLLVRDEPAPKRKVLRAAHEALLRQWRPALTAIEKIADRELRMARARALFGLFAAVVFFGVAIAAVWFWWDSNQKERELAISNMKLTQEREAARSNEEAAMEGRYPELRALLCLGAFRKQPTGETEICLRQAVLAYHDSNGRAVYQGHQGSVRWATFGPKGRYVATASEDGTAALWKRDDGALVRTFADATKNESKYPMHVYQVNFSPDGSQLVAATQEGRMVTWSTETGKKKLDVFAVDPVAPNEPAPLRSAFFSHDGQRILTAGEDRRVVIWNAETGEKLAELEGARGHRKSLYSAVFNPDDSLVATASTDGTIRVLDASGKLVKELLSADEHGSFRSAVFDKSGTLLLGAGKGPAMLWNVGSWTVAGKLSGHSGILRWATFSRDGKLIATASNDAKARIYEVPGTVDGCVAAAVPKNEFPSLGSVNSVEFSEDGDFLLTSSGDNVARLWAINPGTHGVRLQGHSMAVRSITFSADGQRVATASEDGTVAVHSAYKEQPPLYQTDPTAGWINSVGFSEDGQFLVTAGTDKVATIWDWQHKPKHQTLHHNAVVYSAAFSPNGLLVVTASPSRDGLATIWSAKDGERLGACEGHIGRVSSLAFSRKGDSSRFATVGQDGSAKIWRWDGHACSQLVSINTGHGWAYSVALSPKDGKRVVTAGEDGVGRIWDTSSGKQLPVELKGHKGWIYRVAWNDDRIVTSGHDGTVRVWNPHSGENISTFRGPQGWWVYSAEIAADGRRIAVASDSGSAITYGEEFLNPIEDLKREVLKIRKLTDNEMATYIHE